MNIAVYGLWHLGSVTAAGLASVGYDVVGVDDDVAVVDSLSSGRAPLFEPGLDDLVQAGLASGRLRFSGDPGAVGNVDLLWVTFDTPVDDDDRADVNFVIDRVQRILPHLPRGTLVVISSQLPVGTVAALERYASATFPEAALRFACSPENLRLGNALNVFLHPDRVVVGVRSEADRTVLAEVLAPFGCPTEWMSVEAAEMTKHAINAFLASSVAFANEIATICERVGADAKDVERGLKSDTRIGRGAYLGPGPAFAGGTLARDITFLADIATASKARSDLLRAVAISNEKHKNWIKDKVTEILGDLTDKTVAVWGLAYKPGTSALRRSLSVEFCDWLIGVGAKAKVFDSYVTDMPKRWDGVIDRAASPLTSIEAADALVVFSGGDDVRSVSVDDIAAVSPGICVFDASRLLRKGETGQRVRYFCVGAAGC